MIRRVSLVAMMATCVLASGAWAQGSIRQAGPVVSGHIPMWAGNGMVMDAGGSTGAGVAPSNSTTAGTRPTGLALVNSGLGECQYSAYASAAYLSLCTGFDGAGNGLITLNRVGAGAAPTLTFNINGSISQFPGTGTGNILGPVSSTVNEPMVWNNTAGSLARDGAGLAITHTGNWTTIGNTVLTGNLGVTGTPTVTGEMFIPVGVSGNALLIGAGIGGTNASNWLETAIGFTTLKAQFASLSTIGGNGIVGASRMSDNPAASLPLAQGFGIQGFGLMDKAQPASAIFGMFAQCRTVIAGGGNCVVAEFDSLNNGGPHPHWQPYTWVSQLPATGGVGITPGDPGIIPGTNSSYAISITENGTAAGNTAKFETGIFFGALALAGGTGIDGDTTIREAMSLPRMAAINWWNSGNTTTPHASIYSAVVSATLHTQNIKFNSDGIIIEDNTSLAALARFASTAAGDCFFDFSNAVAGKVAFASTHGSTARCDLRYTTKGSASLHSWFLDGTEKLRLNTTGLSAPTSGILQIVHATDSEPLARFTPSLVGVAPCRWDFSNGAGSSTLEATGSPANCISVFGAKGASGSYQWYVSATLRMSLSATGLSVVDNLSSATLTVTQSSPASAAACTAGQIVGDANYLYTCSASGAWKRVAMTGGY